MATVRTHRYTVETGNLAAMLEHRTNLINGIRSANPAFTAATLIRLGDGSYLDIWRWDSAEDMQSAAAAAANFPLVGATLSLTTDRTTIDGEILDER
ncbi:hypothetical protein ACFVWR_07640 [Leifsonia sp. NPDC058292]|uniref:hypothetical protein n=1 Tax=Leifsonia sp. NPDC058292 TaxID=3346428 RepID=UPI0036DA49C0